MKRLKDESGNVAVLVALMMVILLGSTALVTDVGVEFAAKQKLWNALDAGALSGVEEIFNGASAARSTAIQYVQQNGGTVSGVSVNTVTETITVDGQQTVPLYFARVLGYKSANIAIQVQAQAGTLVSGTGFAPIAVAEQNFAYGQTYMLSIGAGQSGNAGGASGGESEGSGGNGGGSEDGSSGNGSAGTSEGSSSEGQGCVSGQTGSSEDGSSQDQSDGGESSCGQAYGSGNYGFLALGGAGAQQFSQNLMVGYSGVLSVGQQVQTEPGDMSGPVSQAVSYRLQQGQGWTFATASNGCPRVILLPVVNTLDVNGKSGVTIVGFAAFYLDGLQGSGGHQQIVGRFLQMVVPGTIGQGTNFGLYGARLIG
ncbi:MAG: pilus assembly protein TadG-related protein [Bacilli bacterium]